MCGVQCIDACKHPLLTLPQGDGSGMAHLISAEVQKRGKLLSRLEQKIIALIVKGNHFARRRCAIPWRRMHAMLDTTHAGLRLSQDLVLRECYSGFVGGALSFSSTTHVHCPCKKRRSKHANKYPLQGRCSMRLRQAETRTL